MTRTLTLLTALLVVLPNTMAQDPGGGVRDAEVTPQVILRALRQAILDDPAIRTVGLREIRLNQDNEISMIGFVGSEEARDQARVLGENLRNAHPEWGVNGIFAGDLEIWNPLSALQDQVSRTPGADGVVFLSVAYDLGGTLRLSGLNDGFPREGLVALARSTFAREGDSSASPAISLHDVRDSDWNRRFLSLGQQRLANATDQNANALKRVRLERVFFKYAEAIDIPELSLEVIAFPAPASRAERPESGDPVDPVNPGENASATENMIDPSVSNDLGTLANELIRLPNVDKFPTQVNFRTGISASDPVAIVQQEIAKRRSLDGVRVSDLFFDGSGRLTLVADLPEGAPNPDLSEVVRSSLDRAGELGLAARGITTQIDRRDPIARWKAEAQNLASSLANETLVARVFFPTPDRLEFEVRHSLTDEGDQSQLVNGLNERIKELVGDPKLPRINAVEQPSFLAHLRSVIPNDPRLDGVRIDRGKYEPPGVLVLSGLVSDPGQVVALQQFVGEQLQREPWRDYAPSGFRMGNFTPYSLAPVLSALRRGIPGVRELDGLNIDRIYYDPEGKLTLSGTFVGRFLGSDPDDAFGAPLKRLLGGDWDIRLNLLTMDRNPDIAEDSLSRGFDRVLAASYADAIPHLDTAVQHDPNSTSARFLRACCYLSTGDRELALRDLQRVRALEDLNQGLLVARGRRLQKFQGPLRTEAEELLKVQPVRASRL